jgi:hypothetical protein
MQNVSGQTGKPRWIILRNGVRSKRFLDVKLATVSDIETGTDKTNLSCD